MKPRRRAVAAVLMVCVLAGCSAPAADQAWAPASAGSESVRSTAAGSAVTAGLAPAAPTSSLPTMTVSELPAQGVATLVLIRDGGPYPYDQDGTTFQNREAVLPTQPRGFYAEYTVPTPGSPDRGARRIVAGDDGSRFYTADHYTSFREVVSG